MRPNLSVKSVLTLIALLLCMVSCRNPNREILHIIHAGSLTVPVKELVKEFKTENPDIEIRTEAWGSKAGARRISDLDTPADLFLSADYMVIENMLIPEHASWYIPFATNKISIVFTENSRYAETINEHNWVEFLLKGDVKYGRSNPDMDPCGVRTLFTLQLAEKMYSMPGIYDIFLKKDVENIRPKETDLIALLVSGQIDYIFLYKSVAVQHNLRYLQLSDSLNMGNFALNNWYRNASATTLGNSPGETITEFGEAMIYGVTIPHKCQNREMADKFVKFLVNQDKGQTIMKRTGQDPASHIDFKYRDKVADYFY